ncbi:MAG: hypothetical protein IKK04_01245 [Bacteroidales bacterium]|nr:hypothetical protein [Bacteroidales bacterium]
MTIVNRFIFPVGHGGFAAEAIEDKYLAVIDCGSDSCPTRVSMYIDEIKKRGFNCVDRLFITHPVTADVPVVFRCVGFAI